MALDPQDENGQLESEPLCSHDDLDLQNCCIACGANCTPVKQRHRVTFTISNETIESERMTVEDVVNEMRSELPRAFDGDIADIAVSELTEE